MHSRLGIAHEYRDILEEYSRLVDPFSRLVAIPDGVFIAGSAPINLLIALQ